MSSLMKGTCFFISPGVSRQASIPPPFPDAQAPVDAPEAPRLRRRHAPVELLEALGLAGHLDAARRVVEAVLDVLALALQREERHLLAVIGGEDEVRGGAGGAAGVRQRAFVDLDHVGPTEAAEVADQAVADDACADDHAVRLCRHCLAGCLAC